MTKKKQQTRTRVTKRSNGKANGSAAPKKKISQRTKSVSLTAAEKAVFSPLREELDTLKLQLADIQVKIMSAESQRLNIAERIVELDKRLLVEAKGVAKSHGIDTEDTSSRWHLDTSGGVFTRVE